MAIIFWLPRHHRTGKERAGLLSKDAAKVLDEGARPRRARQDVMTRARERQCPTADSSDDDDDVSTVSDSLLRFVGMRRRLRRQSSDLLPRGCLGSDALAQTALPFESEGESQRESARETVDARLLSGHPRSESRLARHRERLVSGDEARTPSREWSDVVAALGLSPAKSTVADDSREDDLTPREGGGSGVGSNPVSVEDEGDGDDDSVDGVHLAKDAHRRLSWVESEVQLLAARLRALEKEQATQRQQSWEAEGAVEVSTASYQSVCRESLTRMPLSDERLADSWSPVAMKRAGRWLEVHAATFATAKRATSGDYRGEADAPPPRAPDGDVLASRGYRSYMDASERVGTRGVDSNGQNVGHVVVESIEDDIVKDEGTFERAQEREASVARAATPAPTVALWSSRIAPHIESDRPSPSLVSALALSAASEAAAALDDAEHVQMGVKDFETCTIIAEEYGTLAAASLEASVRQPPSCLTATAEKSCQTDSSSPSFATSSTFPFSVSSDDLSPSSPLPPSPRLWNAPASGESSGQSVVSRERARRLLHRSRQHLSFTTSEQNGIGRYNQVGADAVMSASAAIRRERAPTDPSVWSRLQDEISTVKAEIAKLKEELC